jgi:hypothetical protein
MRAPQRRHQQSGRCVQRQTPRDPDSVRKVTDTPKMNLNESATEHPTKARRKFYLTEIDAGKMPQTNQKHPTHE